VHLTCLDPDNTLWDSEIAGRRCSTSPSRSGTGLRRPLRQRRVRGPAAALRRVEPADADGPARAPPAERRLHRLAGALAPSSPRPARSTCAGPRPATAARRSRTGKSVSDSPCSGCRSSAARRTARRSSTSRSPPRAAAAPPRSPTRCTAARSRPRRARRSRCTTGCRVHGAAPRRPPAARHARASRASRWRAGWSPPRGRLRRRASRRRSSSGLTNGYMGYLVTPGGVRAAALRGRPHRLRHLDLAAGPRRPARADRRHGRRRPGART
jgi:hypothetical protein